MIRAMKFILFFTVMWSCTQRADTIEYSNPIVWEESQSSTDRVYDGIKYIQRAFEQYDVVAIGESHGIKEVTDFYIELVNNDEFHKNVDVIIFEFGNSLYQEDLDKYILGQNDDTIKVKKLWREHTSSFLSSGDRAGVNRFFKEVRKANIESEHKIRILAAEPPIDWSKIKSKEELFVFVGQRDEFYGDLVMSQALKKDKKALLIMGSVHFNKSKPYKDVMDNPISALLKVSDKNIVLIHTLTMDDFPIDQLPDMQKGELIETVNPRVGNIMIGTPFIKDFPLQVQTDALLYLGDRKDLEHEKILPFNDPLYEAELQRRKDLIQMHNGR